MIKIALAALLVSAWIAAPAQAQQPGPPPPPPESGAPADPATPPVKGIPTRTLPGFLIIGSVFNENALAFPGIEVRIRRKTEKKYRWQTLTNSRGEFAVRVPEGPEYEVLVKAKKYQDNVQLVNSTNGDNQQRVSVKMIPLATGKNGAKP
jgi:hypothetical protein